MRASLVLAPLLLAAVYLDPSGAAAQETPDRFAAVPAWRLEIEVTETAESSSGSASRAAVGEAVIRHVPERGDIHVGEAEAVASGDRGLGSYDPALFGEFSGGLSPEQSASRVEAAANVVEDLPAEIEAQLQSLPEPARQMLLQDPEFAAKLAEVRARAPEIAASGAPDTMRLAAGAMRQNAAWLWSSGTVDLEVREDNDWGRGRNCERSRETIRFSGPATFVMAGLIIRADEGKFSLGGVFMGDGAERTVYRSGCSSERDSRRDGVGFEVRGDLPETGLAWSGTKRHSRGDKTLVVHYSIRPLPPCPFEIVSPAADQQFVFSTARPGRLRIPLEVRFEGDECSGGDFEWSADGIEGSQQRFSGGGAAGNHGTKAVLEYIGLPRENDEFGEKELRVSLGDGYEAAVSIEVFYPPEARNHPAPHPTIQKMSVDVPDQDVPNWFYYWSQGAVPGLEDFRYVDAPDLSAGQSRFGWSDTGTGELFVGLDAGGTYPGYSIRLRSVVDFSPMPYHRGLTAEQCTTQGSLQRTIAGTKAIESTARVVMHEKEHLARYNPADDRDTDLIGPTSPSRIWEEPGLCLLEGNPDTHDLGRQLGSDYQLMVKYSKHGDFELLSILAEQSARYVAALDWSCGGKQWQGGACPP